MGTRVRAKRAHKREMRTRETPRMESSTISKSEREGKERKGKKRWKKSEIDHEIVFSRDRASMLSFIFRSEKLIYTLGDCIGYGSWLRGFFSLSGFITHAGSTGPLGSFAFLRASIIVGNCF